jgi:hypothetical protein
MKETKEEMIDRLELVMYVYKVNPTFINLRLIHELRKKINALR